MFKNALAPMVVADLGMTTDLRLVLPMNACVPISVTVLGMSTETSPVIKNAPSAILVRAVALEKSTEVRLGHRGKE